MSAGAAVVGLVSAFVVIKLVLAGLIGRLGRGSRVTASDEVELRVDNSESEYTIRGGAIRDQLCSDRLGPYWFSRGPSQVGRSVTSGGPSADSFNRLVRLIERTITRLWQTELV